MGIYPQILKQSYVNPVFKKGDTAIINNYRPICPLSPVSSIFENIVYNRLMDISKDKISNKQHRFIPGRSITTNLIQLANQVTEALQEESQIDTIYLDLSKAFDAVDH